LTIIALCFFVSSCQNFSLSDETMNEYSKFTASEDFYDKVGAFLETGTADNGGFQFKCLTGCQLVQKNAMVSGGSSAAASKAKANHAAHHSLLQTEEGTNSRQENTKEIIENAFYGKMSEFLETQSKTRDGGDYEFKCDTSCQLVEQNTAPTTPTSSSSSASTSSSSSTNVPPHNVAHNFLETQSGLGVEQKLETQEQVQAQAQVQQVSGQDKAKDCYRLCLNPSMNPGCDVVSLLQTGEMTEEELTRKNWSIGSGSGNCLNSCVHVCMAVHNNIASK